MCCALRDAGAAGPTAGYPSRGAVPGGSSRGRAGPIPSPMAAPDLACPVCNADLPLAGDEKVGDDVFCAYCGAPIVLRAGEDESLLEPEEDF